MTILQLPQGHRRRDEATGFPIKFTGVTFEDALALLKIWDTEFLEKLPHLRVTHRPQWEVLETPARASAPFGYEWWAVDDQGRLFLHSADYDSSG